MAPRSFASRSQEFRGIDGGGLQRGEWRHAGIDHHGEFVVQAEAWEAEGIHSVGSRHYGHASAKHGAEDVLVSGKNTASKLILRVVPDAELRLDAFLPAFAGFFANVGEARVGSNFGFV